MIELGKIQKLVVVNKVEFGVYLGETADAEDKVLLPIKQVPDGTAPGDILEVFVYRDSKDRIISTVNMPKLTVGTVALLNCKEVGKIGAFLDMGLERDLLLPYHEMTLPAKKDEPCLVAMYVDKSSRLAATEKVYDYLRMDSACKKDDEVTGRIYQISNNFGAFVAVDDIYSALIPAKEWSNEYSCGDIINARVTSVNPDGKINLSVHKKAYLQMDDDAEAILKIMDESNGVLPFTDKADPELIKSKCKMSKNAFKRAVGHLMKQGLVKITPNTIERSGKK